MLRNLIQILFLMSIASTNVLNISPAIPLSLLLTGVFISVTFFRSHDEFLKMNYFIPFLLLFFIIISTAFNSPNIVSSKPINHILSFFICFFIYYPCAVIMLKTYGLKNICSKSRIVFHICFILTLVEFVSMNYFGANLLAFLPRPVSEFDYEPLAYTFVRARGLAEESGHWALVSVLLFSMSQSDSDTSNLDLKIKWLMILELILIMFFTFSISGIIVLLVSGLIAPLISHSKLTFKIGMIIFYAFILSLIIYLLDYCLGVTFIDLIYNKINGISGVERAGKISETLSILFDGGSCALLFGLGPAFYDTYNLKTVVSFVFLILFQFGFIGVTLMIMLMVCFLYKTIQTKSSALLFGSIALLIYSMAISNYWFQIIWFYVALVVSVATRTKDKEHEIG